MFLEKLAACLRALLPVSRAIGTGAPFKYNLNPTYTLRFSLNEETADLETRHLARVYDQAARQRGELSVAGDQGALAVVCPLLRETPIILDFVVHRHIFFILSVIMSPRAYRDEFLIMVLRFGHRISVDLALFRCNRLWMGPDGVWAGRWSGTLDWRRNYNIGRC